MGEERQGERARPPEAAGFAALELGERPRQGRWEI